MQDLTLENVLEEKRIERVLMAYAAAIDKRNWPALEQVLAAEATAHYESFGDFTGRRAIVDGVRTFLEGCCGPTQHLVSNLRIAVEGKRATATCYIQAIHVGLGDYKDHLLTVWGEYRDRLELGPEGWRIVHKELALLHVTGDIGGADASNRA